MNHFFRDFINVCCGWVILLAVTSGTSWAEESEKGASQLWAENCARCHNIRSPSQYSDKQWEVIMHHMRVRANLTAEETRVILEYLKAAN